MRPILYLSYRKLANAASEMPSAMSVMNRGGAPGWIMRDPALRTNI